MTTKGTTTRLEISVCDGRQQLRSTPGLLRAMRLSGPPEICRVALVATTALLLGGDRVDLEVHVGPGARLALRDIAGTVAYSGRGQPASWHTRIDLAPDAELVYAGQPFVVADGAAVTRTVTVEAATGASALIRETLVLGRAGEAGGRARERLVVRRAGGDLLVEDQDLDPAARPRPGVLGNHRVVDTLLALGADPGPLPSGAIRFRLLERESSLTRFLGCSLADSGLNRWRASAVVVTGGR